MATSGDVIKIFADVLRIPQPTVNTFYRRLRERGLVTKGGRGISAPNLTPEDVATLLIALLGTAESLEAADIVEKYFDTYAEEYRHPPSYGREEVDISEIQERSFGDAIAYMLSNFHWVHKLVSHRSDSDTPLVIEILPTELKGQIIIGDWGGMYMEPRDDLPDVQSIAPAIKVRRSLEFSAIEAIAVKIFHLK